MDGIFFIVIGIVNIILLAIIAIFVLASNYMFLSEISEIKQILSEQDYGNYCSTDKQALMHYGSYNDEIVDFNLSELRNKLAMFFASDHDITVGYCESIDNAVFIPIVIDDPKKYFALRKILKLRYDFGNVTCYLKLSTIDKAKRSKFKDTKEVFKTALTGNNLFRSVEEVETVFGTTITFIVMAKEVLQYQTDDATDLYGNTNMTVEDAAYSIFNLPMYFYFSTETAIPTFPVE